MHTYVKEREEIMGDYGYMAIYCKYCGGMFYCSDADPLVIADDARQIKKYVKRGHEMRSVTVSEIKANFGGDENCTKCGGK